MDFVESEKHAPSGAYEIRYDDAGHHFTYARDGSAASMWSVSDAQKLPFSDCKAVHASGITQAISKTCRNGSRVAMEMAKAAGCMVSYDPNFRSQLWSLEEARIGLAEALACGPILLPGLDDARLLTGLEATNQVILALQAMGAALVVMTAGDEGVYVGIDGEIIHVHCRLVIPVDASGAGDCFDGAMLTQLGQGATVMDAVAFANEVASTSVQRRGAATSYPTLDEICHYRVADQISQLPEVH